MCHVKGEGGQWVMFNDRKVTESKKTPFGFGYMYLYRNIEA